MGRMPIPDFVLALREKVGSDALPLVGTTGVVRDAAGQLLLGKRSDTGEWALPSGIVEPLEEPAHALAREIREEAGIVVRVDALVAVAAMDAPVVYANGDQATYLDVSFACSHVSGDPYPADGENLEVGWFGLDALPPLRPSSRLRLARALAYDGTTSFAR